MRIGGLTDLTPVGQVHTDVRYVQRLKPSPKYPRRLAVSPKNLTKAGLALTIIFVLAMLLAPVSSADTTIGAYVNQNPSTSGTCGYKGPSEQPCLFVDTVIPALATTAPCDGTVTRFRLNGLPKPNNRYRLRVVRQNPDFSFTGTASSAPVTLATDGVNEFPTNLPIAAGEYIGVDFQGSTEQFGLRWVEQPAPGPTFSTPSRPTAAPPCAPGRARSPTFTTPTSPAPRATLSRCSS